MKIPDFSDFMEELDEDELLKQFASMKPMSFVQFNPSDPASLQEALNIIYKSSVENSRNLSLTYLRAYHEWLREQL